MIVTKEHLNEKVAVAKSETISTLQLVWNAINKSQQQNFLKN